MPFAIEQIGLAGGAGLLSTLSPCVLPILPILLAGARSRHRFGPSALALGLATSFTAMGMLLATAVWQSFDPSLLRSLAALAMLAAGALLCFEGLAQRFGERTARIGQLGQALMDKISGEGWRGQWLLGASLGLVWTPCAGPTLGAAIALASNGRNLPEVGAVMLAFGLGASTPMLVLGHMSRRLQPDEKTRLQHRARFGKRALGVLLFMLGALALCGWDKVVESFLLAHSPDWLVALTSQW